MNSSKSKSKSPSYLIAVQNKKTKSDDLKFATLSDLDGSKSQHSHRKSRRRLLKKLRQQQQGVRKADTESNTASLSLSPEHLSHIINDSSSQPHSTSSTRHINNSYNLTDSQLTNSKTSKFLGSKKLPTDKKSSVNSSVSRQVRPIVNGSDMGVNQTLHSEHTSKHNKKVKIKQSQFSRSVNYEKQAHKQVNNQKASHEAAQTGWNVKVPEFKPAQGQQIQQHVSQHAKTLNANVNANINVNSSVQVSAKNHKPQQSNNNQMQVSDTRVTTQAHQTPPTHSHHHAHIHTQSHSYSQLAASTNIPVKTRSHINKNALSKRHQNPYATHPISHRIHSATTMRSKNKQTFIFEGININKNADIVRRAASQLRCDHYVVNDQTIQHFNANSDNYQYQTSQYENQQAHSNSRHHRRKSRVRHDPKSVIYKYDIAGSNVSSDNRHSFDSNRCTTPERRSLIDKIVMNSTNMKDILVHAQNHQCRFQSREDEDDATIHMNTDRSRSSTLESAEIKPINHISNSNCFQNQTYHVDDQSNSQTKSSTTHSWINDDSFTHEIVSAYSKFFKVPNDVPRRVPGLGITKHHRIWETSKYSNLNWTAKDIAYQIKLNHYLASKMKQKKSKQPVLNKTSR